MDKPASRLIAKALPRSGKFVGQFALPGLVPALVLSPSGKPVLFDGEQDAENAARVAVIDLYDRRTRDTRKATGYKRLPGAELALLLNEINITVTYFAEIAGVPQHRVMKWIDGEQDIPHSVHVLARLLAASDANFEIAQEITEQWRDEQ